MLLDRPNFFRLNLFLVFLACCQLAMAQPNSNPTGSIPVDSQVVQWDGSTITIPIGDSRVATNGNQTRKQVSREIGSSQWAFGESDFLNTEFFAGGPSGWSNHGGNAQKNGFSPVMGPLREELAWEVNETALISFQPYILDERVFVVRMKQFVGSSANDRIYAYDLDTGEELWDLMLPYDGNNSLQWTAHILGVNAGVLYVSRSGNGNSIEDHVTAYSAADGSFIWQSEDTTDTGTYGGCVFAPNGDLVIGSFDNIRRIRAIDGSTAWTATRSCPTSGACVPALGPDGVFIKVARPGGRTAIAKHDLETGNFLYRSIDMVGLITQNAPFLTSDGQTIYHAKQHSTGQNFLYSFADTGTSLDFNWMTPINYSAYQLHGLGPDGSIFTFRPDDEFVRVDPTTGQTADSAGILTPRSAGTQTAVDANGNVYVSNGWASSPASEGKLWAFSQGLTPLFDMNFQRQNSGGPALGPDGTLVVADLNGIRAYRSAVLRGDVNQDGVVNLLDVAPFIALIQDGLYQIEADINQDGAVDLLDVQPFVELIAG